MDKYLTLFKEELFGYADYLWKSIINPSATNYFYLLIIFSMLVWGLEIIFPWRKGQQVIRKDFWQDIFYMFFNFFLFNLIGYSALSKVGVNLFSDILFLFGIHNMVAIELSNLSIWIQFVILFLLADFVQWAVHVMLHKVKWMWRFHQVHHSVTEMGFAAHLRFHWMETIFYKTALFLPLTMIGFGLDDLFLWHAFTILIGHLNHANINWNYGPLKYVLNSPHMHIWHHAKELPKSRRNGVNFGITLSIWDYLFKTAFVPSTGKDIDLGFDDIDKYPTSIIGQMKEPFRNTKK